MQMIEHTMVQVLNYCPIIFLGVADNFQLVFIVYHLLDSKKRKTCFRPLWDTLHDIFGKGKEGVLCNIIVWSKKMDAKNGQCFMS